MEYIYAIKKGSKFTAKTYNFNTNKMEKVKIYKLEYYYKPFLCGLENIENRKAMRRLERIKKSWKGDSPLFIQFGKDIYGNPKIYKWHSKNIIWSDRNEFPEEDYIGDIVLVNGVKELIKRR